jgi:hypothetical protein
MHPIIDCLFVAQNITKGLELNIINLLKKEKLINNVVNELRKQGFHKGLPIAKKEFNDKLKLVYIKAIEEQLKHKIEKKLSSYLDKLTDFGILKGYLAKEVNERNSQIINDALEKFNASLDYLEDIEVNEGKKVLTLENYIKDQLGIEFLPQLVAV